MNYKKTAIIVAGGKGERMKTAVPKQFLELSGMPILMHTIKKIYDYDNAIELVLALPESQIEYWKGLCKKHDFMISHQIAAGGETRFFSVKNALNTLDDTDRLIAVHDGVRPLVSHDTLKRCFEKAEEKGSAIPVVSLIDSIRRIDGEESVSLNRNEYRLVQTPQVFYSEIIKKSYDCAYKDEFTDDASVVESGGYKVHLVEGNSENIKITNGLDLEIAEIIMKRLKS
ncbi:MAG: 2-C-methyl-D-erythritol 4-phosphate cytidylyltransferase [Porphyromonadaceae bacterium]|nr:2-C-methyl-D-erythritol 4-phosphate cytidylyltransferase [Porphyromonadaceae bacterium]